MPITIQVTLGDDAIAAIARAIQGGNPMPLLESQLGATQIADFPTQPAPSTTQVTQAQPAAAPAFPAATAPPSSDPWANPTAPSAAPWPPAPAGFSAPAAPPAYPQQPAAVATQQTDKWGNTYTFNQPGAPACKHGQPSALKSGMSKQNKPYTGWTCALNLNDYKNACDFYQKL